eukprot:jgi/Psemu1/5609/gm1.5609_g
MGTGSLLKKILEAQKQLPEHRKKRKRPDATVPQSNVLMFRVVLGVLFLTAVVHPGFAPPKGPKLPEGLSWPEFHGTRERKERKGKGMGPAFLEQKKLGWLSSDDTIVR